jgi:hypothetical protein
MGRNGEDVNEYRFGHMSYQEYLTGREYYQELTAARFTTAALVKLFGDQPLDAFTDAKQHLVLQLLAGILSPEQRTICVAVMCGGRIEVPVLIQSSKSANSARCAVVGCPGTHHSADGYWLWHGYCHNHRDAAASVLANATVQGGYTMKIEKKLGRAEMEALAPYLRDNTRLRTLVLGGTELGKDKDGLKVLVELLARCVRVVFFFFPAATCANSILVSNTTSAIISVPLTTPLSPTPRKHPWHHTLGNTAGITSSATPPTLTPESHLDNTPDTTSRQYQRQYPDITSRLYNDNTPTTPPTIPTKTLPTTPPTITPTSTSATKGRYRRLSSSQMVFSIKSRGGP